MIDAYPLAWPTGWPRTAVTNRRDSPFGKRSWNETAGRSILRELSIDEGTKRILGELSRMGVDRGTIVISTNLRLRGDGLPHSKQAQPADVGVAVYWTAPDGARQASCMAIDIYTRIADNLGAVAASIEALRLIERHGGAQILARAFAGFAALPDPTRLRPWREVLGIGADVKDPRATLVARYREERSRAHPDREGGDARRFHEVQKAYEQACVELGIA